MQTFTLLLNFQGRFNIKQARLEIVLPNFPMMVNGSFDFLRIKRKAGRSGASSEFGSKATTRIVIKYIYCTTLSSKCTSGTKQEVHLSFRFQFKSATLQRFCGFCRNGNLLSYLPIKMIGNSTSQPNINNFLLISGRCNRLLFPASDKILFHKYDAPE